MTAEAPRAGGSRRILVTGGAGFIGSNLVRLLLGEGHEVTVLDNLSTAPPGFLDGLDVRLVERDILEADRLAPAMDGCAAVVHLAAQSGVPSSVADPRRDCQINIVGTLNVLEAAREAGVPRVVFASSQAPLGRAAVPSTESSACLPTSPYGASKLAGEGYCLAYHSSYGLSTVVLRFSNVYGPFSIHKASLVAQFFKAALAGDDLVVDGDGEQTRDYIFVGDLCGAILAAVRTERSGEIFHVATGRPTSVLEMASMVGRVVGAGPHLVHGPPRAGDMRHNYSSIVKARDGLGWESRTGLAEGLGRTWEWMQAWAGTVG